METNISSVLLLLLFSCSVVSDFVTSCTAAHQASLSFTISLSWLTCQASYPLSPSSPPALSLSKHQGLFQWISSLYQVAKVLELQIQHQSFQWIFRSDFLEDWLVGSPCSPRDSQESSPTPQFKSIQSWWSTYFRVQSHIHTWLLEKPWLWLDRPLLAK